MEGGDKKRFRARTFAAGDAINSATNYFIEWADLPQMLTDITDDSRWLLITGPWQSGKSSLMFALADGSMKRGFQPVVTILSSQMVALANDVAKSELQASDAFFGLLADRLARNSRGTLTRGTSRGVEGVTEMFQGHHEKQIIWFIDEASLLNDIKRVSIIQTLLSELRAVKQQCVSRQAAGSYYLRSFVLVGTPKLKQLIGDLRIERTRQEPGWNPNDPLGNSITPLSMERSRPSDVLSVEDIVQLLSNYSFEHDDCDFRVDDEFPADSKRAIQKFSKSIWGLTSGHKGMVCTCCEYLTRNSIYTYTKWRWQVSVGHVAKYVFYSKTYARMVSNVTEYPAEAREVIFECIQRRSATVSDLFVVLGPLNDGVLEQVSDATVALTSDLLLAAFLEDCSFSFLEALPLIGSFVEVIQTTFCFINCDRLTRDKVLNANGQPSEYVWQCEFLLAFKFVLENAYKACKYAIMVEAKRKDKDGQRRTRLDFLFKNSGSPAKGFELQGAAVGAAGEEQILKHLKKSEEYRKLHSCEMHYVYLQYGNFGVDAMPIIQRESSKFKQLNCWFVRYLPEAKKWNIGGLMHGFDWSFVQKDVAENFPKFMFQKRRSV